MFYATLSCVALVNPVAASADEGSLKVELVTQVPARCGFVAGSLIGQSATPDLERAARFDIRVKLNCNTPYSFGILAEQGKLTNRDAVPDRSGYAFAKPYRVSVALDTDRGGVKSDFCRSTELVSGGHCAFAADAPGAGLSSRRGISINRDAILTVEWADQATMPSRLAAGRYQDTLTMVIGPRA